ncbi:MAG: DUF389 domain-containing protein [Saprospiraceae bacterium]|nr:DUF389 domain-containing protein [Saprospiraceae bacterium]
MNNQDSAPEEDITKEIHSDFARLRQNLGKFLKGLTSLRPGLDREGTIRRIKENKRIQGANAWLLMCSIMVASLGLDLNSPAVIIGGMLISPLMSPILGLGLGIATNDRDALSTAGRHFGIAIGIALFTSTVYFFITPFGELTDEIVMRTEPTFLDVLVAFFGGIAGIISVSREEQSSAIPGVAIATALMPPLCVTGFGLAKALESMLGLGIPANFDTSSLIFNSFYLFFLNSFFVAAATFLIVRYLNFPFKKYPDVRTRKRTLLFIFSFSLLMIIPSFFILRRVLQKVNIERGRQRFIQEYLEEKSKYLDDCQIVETDDGKTLVLKVYGSVINMSDSVLYKEGMQAVGLGDLDLEIIPTSEIDLSLFSSLQAQFEHFNTSFDERLDIFRETQRSDLNALATNQEKLSKKASYTQLLGELLILFDGLEEVAYAEHHLSSDSTLAPVLMLKWATEKDRDELLREQDKIKALCDGRDLPISLLSVLE